MRPGREDRVSAAAHFQGVYMQKLMVAATAASLLTLAACSENQRDPVSTSATSPVPARFSESTSATTMTEGAATPHSTSPRRLDL